MTARTRYGSLPAVTTVASGRFRCGGGPIFRSFPEQYRKHRYWLVKDPVSLNYFHLREEEHAILEMLDGRTGLAAIKSRFEKRFAPYRLPLVQLEAFLARLYECGLICSPTPPVKASNCSSADEQRRHERWLSMGANLLAIRFPGIDPQPFLQGLSRRCRFCFTRTGVIAVLLLGLAAATVVLGHVPAVSAMRGEIREFLRPGNLVWLAVVLAAAKVFHELGHALACISLDGQCRELGLMLLAFTPCLYCDVSDAWKFPDKWRRMGVSAAGILVEICFAACWPRCFGATAAPAFSMRFVSTSCWFAR